MTNDVLFAGAAIGLIALIMVIALLRHPMDNVIKLWAAVGPVFGAILASATGHFFTKDTISRAAVVAQEVADTRAAAVAGVMAGSVNAVVKENEALKEAVGIARQYAAVSYGREQPAWSVAPVDTLEAAIDRISEQRAPLAAPHTP